MGYDVTPLQACLMYANLSELVTKTTVWPHPEDLFMGGSKVQCYETLRIASLSMGVPTPFYVILGENISDPTFVKDFAEGRVQGVLKRDYSMKSQHVIFPTTPNTASTIQNALNEEKKTWNTVEELFGRPQWFLQPTVAHLLHVGEVRCFIVGGRLVYKVTTTPIKGGGVHVTNHEPTRPLHTHLWVFAFLRLFILFCSNIGSSYDPSKEFPYTYFTTDPEIDYTEFDDPKSNLDVFALEILARVILLEERRLRRWSGLRVFCRLDVSIYREQEGGLHHYFVNEITRTHGAGLFSLWDTNIRLNGFFNHMSQVLHHISSTEMTVWTG